MFWRSLSIQSIIASTLPLSVWGYIPAFPANITGTRLDVHDDSTLDLTWHPTNGYSSSISYQQPGPLSSGISFGALIYIKEEDIPINDTDFTSTPWIAFINCDRNSTPINMDLDIFSMVSQRGASAALLYSNTSDGCLMTDEFLNSGIFGQLFDIFTTKSSASAKIVHSQYQYIAHNYSQFDSGLLNGSATAINDAIPLDAHNNSPYMVAKLRAWNATGELPGDPTATSNPTHSTTNTSSNQSLAMIVLYVIVSIVSALFIIVILSGAVRAFRHPERYGPRLYHPGMDGDEAPPQTRAAGITRAILDTFPVVKFGRNNESAATVARNNMISHQHEMKNWDSEAANHSASSSSFLQAQQSPPNAKSEDSHGARTLVRSSVDSAKKRASATSQPPRSPTGTAGNASPSDIDPAAIGTETCPICIVDFEEGDDLRVLPCDGKHRFHKDCVDPWLLELSTFCPICRQDFQRLEDMATAAGSEEREHDEDEDRFSHDQQGASPTPVSRFSRYMRFAQRRRRSQRDSNTSTRNATPVQPSAPYTDY